LLNLVIENSVDRFFGVTYSIGSVQLAHKIQLEIESAIVNVSGAVQESVHQVVEYINFRVVYMIHGDVAQLFKSFPYEGIVVMNFFELRCRIEWKTLQRDSKINKTDFKKFKLRQ